MRATASHRRRIAPPQCRFGDELPPRKAGGILNLPPYLVANLGLHAQQAGAVRPLVLAIVNDAHVHYWIVFIVVGFTPDVDLVEVSSGAPAIPPGT